MKVETKVGKVFMSEGMEVYKARIKINRQSFKILYGDLYSDKIRAVVRELSTNAHDSHVKAGKPESPFEIHLPNALEPYFYVKDFGTGLSSEQVYGEKDGIYITFCDSDKVHSDDFTGCLGLGSKSPLTYTDNFSVESNYNGVKYSYAMFLDDEGEPCITPLGQCDTTEPNGLKVEFAVKEDDFDEVKGKVADVLSWFKVRPMVVGDSTFQFKEREYLRKTDRYGVRKDRQDESNVVMGNVAYPIRTSDFTYNKLDDIERAVVEYGVDLFVGIGDVEFVPSREKLSYTEKTIANVKKYLADAIKSIREELEMQVQTQTSTWAARRMLHDIKNSILGKVRALGTVMFQGKEIAEYVNFHKMVEKLMPGMERTNSLYPKLEVLSKKKEHYRRRDEDNVHCDGTKIYFNDLPHGGYVRIHKDVREHGCGKHVYMLTGVTPEFLEYTGIGEVAIKASSLPPIERIKREVVDNNGTRTYVKRTVLQEYLPSGGNYMADYWRDIEVDPRAGGIYVVCSYGQIVDGELKTLPSEIKKRYNAVKALRPDFKLMGIRPAHMGKIEKHKSRWMKFDDYADLVLKSEFPQAIEKIQLLRQFDNLQNRDRYEQFMDEVFEEYSTFGKFLAKLNEAKALHDDIKVKAVLRLNEEVKNPLPMDGEAQELNKMGEALDEAYPLINYINWYSGRRGEFTDHFSEYMRGIDDRNFKVSLQPMKEAV